MWHVHTAVTAKADISSQSQWSEIFRVAVYYGTQEILLFGQECSKENRSPVPADWHKTCVCVTDNRASLTHWQQESDTYVSACQHCRCKTGKPYYPSEKKTTKQ